LKRLYRRYFDSELPVPGEKWRRYCKFGVAVFAINFTALVITDALFNQNIMLGPGLVDTGKSGFDRAREVLSPLLDDHQFIFLTILLPGVVICLLVNALGTYRGFADYEQFRGEPYPLQVLVTFFLLNGILVGMLACMLLLCGLIALAMGLTFNDGTDVVYHMTRYSQKLVDGVPTLFHLPYPLPLLAALIVVDFFRYWFHRWGHTLRVWWMLWHRPHHMTPALINLTTLPVFTAAPLFLIFSVPFQVGTGMLAKIFGPETMIMEALLLNVVTNTLVVFSHNSAYYEWFGRSRVRMFLGCMLGVGNYHYMHHSALPGHQAINISGMPFYLWDRVFGTYVKPSDEKPPIGLTGSPALVMNPLRLALAGLAQLLFELRHNKPLATRVKILFASTDWNPPITKNYAVKDWS